MHPNVQSSTIYNSQDMEATWMSTDRQTWLKGCSGYIKNGILHGHKKEWNNGICNNMNKPRYYHTKWSKSEREKTNTIKYH